MRLDDDRTVDFVLGDRGIITAVRLWCCRDGTVPCAGLCGQKHPELEVVDDHGERH
jgi:hypothetical protein